MKTHENKRNEWKDENHIKRIERQIAAIYSGARNTSPKLLFLAFERNQDEWTGNLWWVSWYPIHSARVRARRLCDFFAINRFSGRLSFAKQSLDVPCTMYNHLLQLGRVPVWGIWETIPFIVGSSFIFTSPTRVLALAQLPAGSATTDPLLRATKKNVLLYNSQDCWAAFPHTLKHKWREVSQHLSTQQCLGKPVI